jgi:diketogulonate reductase-like aldo/keto reductase
MSSIGWNSIAAGAPFFCDAGVIAWLRLHGHQLRPWGITFFDTAEAYGPFTNEELVGDARAPSASNDRSGR